MEKQKQASGQQTGASNLEFDLYSEIHSLLKGNAALTRYIEDARHEADKEVERCFQTLLDQNKQHVLELRGLIVQRIAKAAA